MAKIQRSLRRLMSVKRAKVSKKNFSYLTLVYFPKRPGLEKCIGRDLLLKFELKQCIALTRVFDDGNGWWGIFWEIGKDGSRRRKREQRCHGVIVASGPHEGESLSVTTNCVSGPVALRPTPVGGREVNWRG